MDSTGKEAAPVEPPDLIRTKIQLPRLGTDLIDRSHLIERLNRGMDKKLTLISAQAGAGKTTLLAQWLHERSEPSAWLSLDKYDNDFLVFVSYLCRSIRTAIRGSCEDVLELLNASYPPPPRIITTSLVNDLEEIFRRSSARQAVEDPDIGLILALDDYQAIKDPAIHELMAQLMTYLPRSVHLAIATRTDPPLPLAGLRARNEMNELRTSDLRFRREEAASMLELTARRPLTAETVDLLEEKTEGWAAGLRLAALSLRDRVSADRFAQTFRGTTNPAIMDYLVGEVIANLSAVHQEFLLQTSLLDRFCADLCDVLIAEDDGTRPLTVRQESSQSREILAYLNSANLFVIPLDQEGFWFRYHQLFRDLLRHRLYLDKDAESIKETQIRASRWFEEKGLIDEALALAFSTGNLDLAAGIIAGQRYSLMNQAQWQRLDRYLHQFPPEFASQQPDLLMLKAWLLYHLGHYDQLPIAIEKVVAALDRASLSKDEVRHFRGEISALLSLLAYFRTEVDKTKNEARFSIKNTPPELWIVRSLARMTLAGAHQLEGDLSRAYDVIYRGIDEEFDQSNPHKATLLLTVCNIYWIAADLQGLAEAAQQCLSLCDYHHSEEICGFANYHLGRVCYQKDDLAAAEEYFTAVVKQPYRNYGNAFSDSVFGLALLYQARNRPEEATKMAALAAAHMIETGNTSLLKDAHAFRAEIALRQGDLPLAERWADQFETFPPILPMYKMYEPLFTHIRVRLAQDTPESRQQAAKILDALQEYTARAHNTVSLIQVLSLKSILHAKVGEEAAALSLLAKAVELAEPGGFIRLFVDLGSPIPQLLSKLQDEAVSPTYINQIKAAFGKDVLDLGTGGGAVEQTLPIEIIVSLTPREVEVLELLANRMTNKEIAQRLVISPGTVKTHTLNIYSKLDVGGRRQAVERARELDLLT